MYSTSTAEVIIRAHAVKYAVDGDTLVNTLKCESGLNARAIGDKGTSIGVAQIHLPAHKDISKEEALDPLFSIDWAAYQFSQGKQNMWSCYKMIYGAEKS